MQSEKENSESNEERRKPRRAALDQSLNRVLRRLFFGLAIILAIGSVTVWCDLGSIGLNPMRAKSFWAMIAGAVGLVIIGWKSLASTKFKIFLLLLTFAFVELLLQIASWLGVLPGVNTKERLPYGRVYWTGEGLGNSIRNRYGWYYPEFDLQKSNRLAIIGDSFVEAVEVHRTRNMSAMLDKRMRERPEAPAVMALGNHGTGPAQYLEVLQYAHRHFAITEAILVIYLGNDISDCSLSLKKVGPERFTYYSLQPDHSLAMDPVSERSIEEYRHVLESSHRPLWLFAPRLAVSHCMSVQLPLGVRRAREKRRIISESHAPTNSLDAQLEQLGLPPEPFAVPPTPEVKEAMAVLKLLLDRAAEFAAQKGIQLRIMTVPFFPPDFYLQRGVGWSAKMRGYDFLAPERTLSDWASQRHIAFLGLGELMRKQRLSTADIRALYFSDGSGHFNESGHRFAALAQETAFFDGPNSKP